MVERRQFLKQVGRDLSVDGGPFEPLSAFPLPACSASVACSCVRSVILTAEHFLHFQLNRNKNPPLLNLNFQLRAMTRESVRMLETAAAQAGRTLREVLLLRRYPRSASS